MHESKHQQGTKPKAKDTPVGDGESTKDKAKKQKPPFLKHTKKTGGVNAEAYKVSDMKVWSEKEWYFCNCPSHHDGAHFHPHKAEDCCTQKKWLQQASSSPKKDNAMSNVVEAADGHHTDQDAEEEDQLVGTQMALAAAFQALHYDPQAQVLIANMLESVGDKE